MLRCKNSNISNCVRTVDAIRKITARTLNILSYFTFHTANPLIATSKQQSEGNGILPHQVILTELGIGIIMKYEWSILLYLCIGHKASIARESWHLTSLDFTIFLYMYYTLWKYCAIVIFVSMSPIKI